MARMPDRLDRAIPNGRRGVVGIDPGAAVAGEMDAVQIRGRGVQNLAAGVGAAGANLQRAADAADQLSAEHAYGQWAKAKVEQDGAYLKDPDWATQETRYGEALGTVRGDLLKGITSPKLRAKFEADTNVDLAQGTQRIRAGAWEKEASEGVDRLNNQVAENVKTALADPSAAPTILASTARLIDGAVGASYLGQQGGVELKRKLTEQYAGRWLETMGPEDQLAALLGAPKSAIVRTALPGDMGSYEARVAQIESGGNPKAVNPTSGAWGKYQFTNATGAAYGITKDSPPAAQEKAFKQLTADNAASLTAALSRQPTPAELYLAHQQGAAGAAALLLNPDQPAWAVLTEFTGDAGTAKQRILQNGGTEGMTARQFTSLWGQRYGGGDTQAVGGALALDGNPPPGGWDFSKPTGTAVDFLPADVRANLIRTATKAVKDESKVALQALTTELQVTEKDANQNAFLTGEADPVRAAKLAAVNPAAAAEYASIAQTGRDVKAISQQPNAALVAMDIAAQAAAKVPGPGSAAAAARADQISKAVDYTIKARAADPAGYVGENDEIGRDALAQLNNADQTTEAGKVEARTAMATLQARQAALGIQQPRALPLARAKAVVAAIEGERTPKGQFDTLLAALDVGDDAMSRQIIMDLNAAGAKLPPGADLVADLAVTGDNRALGERLWAQLTADTKGVELTTAGKQAVATATQNDMGYVLGKQADITGSGYNAVGSLSAAIEQMAKARILTGVDPDEAVETATADLTSQFSTIEDEGLAMVYYPSGVDGAAMADGLTYLRDDAAETIRSASGGDARVELLAQDIQGSAVWVNDGDGLALIVPGTNRYLARTTFADAVKAGGRVSGDAVTDQYLQTPTP